MSVSHFSDPSLVYFFFLRNTHMRFKTLPPGVGAFGIIKRKGSEVIQIGTSQVQPGEGKNTAPYDKREREGERRCVKNKKNWNRSRVDHS